MMSNTLTLCTVWGPFTPGGFTPALRPGFHCDWDSLITSTCFFKYFSNPGLALHNTVFMLSLSSYCKCLLTIMTYNKEALASLTWKDQSSRSCSAALLDLPPVTSAANRLSTGSQRRHQLCKLVLMFPVSCKPPGPCVWPTGDFCALHLVRWRPWSVWLWQQSLDFLKGWMKITC